MLSNMKTYFTVNYESDIYDNLIELWDRERLQERRGKIN